MKPGEITIDARYRGPPNSGNGGYVCGRLAEYVDGPAEVTLRRPPPLDKAMSVVRGEDDKVLLLDDGALVAEAIPSQVSLQVPKAPSFDGAVEASGRTFDPSDHKLPTCFVCGPDREHPDGLRIFPGPLNKDDANWEHELAAHWIPSPDLAGDDARVAPEFIWAALDCPTGFTDFKSGQPRLLGRLAVAIDQSPAAGERCVIVTWREKVEGRKLSSVGILYSEDGQQLARARATWIAVDEATMRGDI